MSYQTLYRKYRSSDFSQLIGQDHIIQTLSNAIEHNRLGHAYIFSGPRGTGKTSTARIVAKMVNKTTDSITDCSLCDRITNGTLVDVIEIDAASHTGVDHMRQLTDQSYFLPVESKVKVFIIDEVHMLSTGAFNALLKTLEEPPENVLFLLATTELHKIPATIQSRAQTCHFKLIDPSDMRDHLTNVCIQENLNPSTRAIEKIVHQSQGGMRDALSLLDQCINVSTNHELTEETVSKVLGVVSDEHMKNFLLVCFSYDMKAKDHLLELLESGIHVVQLYENIVHFLNQKLLSPCDHFKDTYQVSQWLLWFCDQIRLVKQSHDPTIFATVYLVQVILNQSLTTEALNKFQSNTGFSSTNGSVKKVASSNISGVTDVTSTMTESLSLSNDQSNTSTVGKVSKNQLKQLVKPKSNESKPKTNDVKSSITVSESDPLAFKKPINKPVNGELNTMSSSNERTHSIQPMTAKEAWPIVLQRTKSEFPPLLPFLSKASVMDQQGTLFLILDQTYQFFIYKLSEPKYKQWFLNQFESCMASRPIDWKVTCNIDEVHQFKPHQSKDISVNLDTNQPTSSKTIDSSSKESFTIDELTDVEVKSKTVNQVIEMFDGKIIE